MPKFQLNKPPSAREINSAVANYGARPRRVHPYFDLSTFAKGYVEAMFFTNGDTGDERDFLLNEWGVDKLTRASVKQIAKDCAGFESGAADLLACAYSTDEYEVEQAGRDFWFTRQGHGVGFWDRRELDHDVYEFEGKPVIVTRNDEPGYKFLGNLGRLLSDAAKAFGECNVETYRGWIYVR